MLLLHIYRQKEPYFPWPFFKRTTYKAGWPVVRGSLHCSAAESIGKRATTKYIYHTSIYCMPSYNVFLLNADTGIMCDIYF